MSTLDLSRLRRFPDVEAPNLVAVDASDRLILDEAAPALAAAAARIADGGASGVVVIGDHYGALTLGAADAHGLRDLRVHQDMVTGERALAHNARAAGLEGAWRSLDLVAELVTDARVVLLQLPRGLAALEEIAQLVAAHAHPDVQVVAGGRIKHMARTMNDVLARSFRDVTASLARQKSRVLHASGPTPSPAPTTFPQEGFDDEQALTILAHGAAFAGPQLDVGARYLLSFLDRMAPTAHDAIDLGCGTGALVTALASARPDLTLVATDASSAAVRSTRATLAANHLADRATVVREDGLTERPDASADLIVCNPPFHVGATLAPDAALGMLRGSARVLRPGGELWTVFNSRLGHAGALRRILGPTQVVGDNGTFTVTRSVRPERKNPR